MSLFKLPERKEDDIERIVAKTKELIDRPQIKLKGSSLLSKITLINQNIKSIFGDDKYKLITTDNEFIKYCENAVKDGIIAIDTETTSLDSMLAKLVGVCLYSPSQEPAYVAVGHISAITEQPIKEQVSMEAIKRGFEILLNGKTKNIFHHAYYDLVIIYVNCGIMLPVFWDTLPAAYLLNENESHGLKELYVKYCTDGEEAHKFAELFEDIPFCYIPPSIAEKYGARDALMTYRLYKFQEEFYDPTNTECQEYELEGVAELYRSDILPMIPVLVDMKLAGMEFDFDMAKSLKEKYTKLKEDSAVRFNKAVEPYKERIEEYNKSHTKKLPYPLNYNSPDQIKALFYDIAHIGVVYRKEPTGTGKNVLNQVINLKRFENDPIKDVAIALLDVKTYDKVLGTFIEKLTEDAVLHGGKIYANLSLTSARTGRLASSSPKQNWVYME